MSSCPIALPHLHTLRLTRCVVGVLLALLLAGCAAQRHHDKGWELARQGLLTEALAEMEQASLLEPRSALYRLGVLQITQLQKNAEAAARRAAPLPTPEPPRTTEILPPHERQALRAETIRPALAERFRRPITIEFKDVSLQTVLDVIARSAGLNIVVDKDVRTDQKTSVYLRQSTVEKAIVMALMPQQLTYRALDDNTLLIYPNTSAKLKDYQPLQLRSYYLRHADVKAVAQAVKTLLKVRDVVTDEKLNLLLVRDTPDVLNLTDQLVTLQDLAEPEVMLEVEIVEVKRTRELNLGVRWPDQLGLSPLAGTAGEPVTLADLRRLSAATTAATLPPTTLRAGQTDIHTDILANPRIRSRNRDKARILIGERVPNITSTSTATGFVAESVTYVDVGLKLDVEPTISLAGEVIIRVGLEVSNIIGQVQSKQGSVAFQIGTRTAQTVLRLRDGESQVLAGLISDEDRSTRNKLPGMGELPVLGRLFGQHADNTSKTEIVLSITPRIVRGLQTPRADQQTLETGTENPSLPWPSTDSRVDPPLLAPEPPPPVAHRLSWTDPQPGSAGQTRASELRWTPAAVAAAAQSLSLMVGFDPVATQVLDVEPGPGLQSGSLSHRIDPAGRVLIQLQPAAGTTDTAITLVRLLWRANTDGAATPPWPLEQVLAHDAEGKPVPVIVPGTTAATRP